MRRDHQSHAEKSRVNWLLPILTIPPKGNRVAYFRDYYKRNLEARRAYLAKYARDRRAARKAA